MTARCPASETAVAAARNSGSYAMSHCPRSSEHTPHAHEDVRRETDGQTFFTPALLERGEKEERARKLDNLSTLSFHFLMVWAWGRAKITDIHMYMNLPITPLYWHPQRDGERYRRKRRKRDCIFKQRNLGSVALSSFKERRVMRCLPIASFFWIGILYVCGRVCVSVCVLLRQRETVCGYTVAFYLILVQV